MMARLAQRALMTSDLPADGESAEPEGRSSVCTMAQVEVVELVRDGRRRQAEQIAHDLTTDRQGRSLKLRNFKQFRKVP